MPIFPSSDTSDPQIKIADFGLSVKLDNPSQIANTACGTPGYLAPELWNKTGYTNKIDMYSAGVILYAL